jgi:hypothetical protein
LQMPLLPRCLFRMRELQRVVFGQLIVMYLEAGTSFIVNV